VALGSARLSIIDLAGGQQPIANEDETMWIVFNGEIFNYPELRKGLETRGHRFRTGADTEVLLHLYEEVGAECLSRLNGQFAFAIWDSRAQSLFLARDRLGIRPLFYTTANGALIFASEMKAILACPGVSREIDPVGMDEIFVFWSTLPGRTVFRGIHDLPPAHYMLARGSTIDVRPYWQIDFIDGEGNGKPPGEYLDEFRSLLVDATAVRLRADVPVGAYLSGGLDSSVVTAIARKHAPNRLDTFSIAFADPDFDESDFQLRMADHLGTRHEVIHVNDADIANIFPEMIWHTETPTMRTAPAPMFMLSKLVRDCGMKVVLTGEGADEFLGGYDIFKEDKVRRFWARHVDSKLRPALLRRLYPEIRGLQRSSFRFVTDFFRQGLLETESPGYSHAIRWRNNSRTRRFFSDELLWLIAAERPDFVRYPSQFARWGPLERGQYLESTIFLSQYLLSTQGDRVAMAHSVEGRLPYLDYRIVEFCNRLPASLKLHVMTEKYLLRLLGRELLPSEIWRRRKRPYRAPIHRSFFGKASPEYIGDLLDPARIKAAGLFRSDAVAALRKKAAAGIGLGETDDMAVAGIVSAQLVYDQFVSHLKMPPPISAADRIKTCAGRRLQNWSNQHEIRQTRLGF
jgi:asparagine synthase (glutamine-hydrolysing)